MRQLFLVGAKLLGLYYIVSGLIDGMVLPRMAPSATPLDSQIALACLIHLVAGTALTLFHGDRRDRIANPRIDRGPRAAS